MNINELLSKIRNARVGILGDFCLDVYWKADMKRSQLSRETPHYPLPVVEERMSPGGAGNVAANAAALGAKVTAIGIVGSDWRGNALVNALNEHGISADTLIQANDRVTNTYIKPLRAGISDVVYEDPRLDFENYELPDEATEQALIDVLLKTAPDLDVLCVCDQMQYGSVTPKIRETVSKLAENGLPVFVDSRSRIGLYEHCIVKPNDVEAEAATGISDSEKAARFLSEKNGCPAIVTVGEHGCYVCENGNVVLRPARKVEPPVDFVGAGDTFLSGISCAYAAGAAITDAAMFANVASSITVKKIGTTGTASPDEMTRAWRDVE